MFAIDAKKNMCKWFSTCVCFCLTCGQRLTDKCEINSSFATHNSLFSMSFDTDKKEHDP